MFVTRPFVAENCFKVSFISQTSLGWVKPQARIWPRALKAITHLTWWRLEDPPGVLLRRVSGPWMLTWSLSPLLLFSSASSTHSLLKQLIAVVPFHVEQKRLQQSWNPKPWAGDWRALTESNPSSLAEDFPPPPFCCCLPPLLLRSPPFLPSPSLSGWLERSSWALSSCGSILGGRASPHHTPIPAVEASP